MHRLKTFAYCCAEWKEAALHATGVEPETSPPLDVDSFFPKWLEGQELLYFDLHGHEGQAAWYNNAGVVAMTASQITSVNLAGAVVFLANCYSDENSPMLQALLQAGAGAVVAGGGPNYGPTRDAGYGAALLGRLFVKGLEAGIDPGLAFAEALVDLRNDPMTLVRSFTSKFLGLSAKRLAATVDTLQFKFYPGKVQHGS